MAKNYNKKFLDSAGLEVLVSNIHSKFATIASVTAPADGKSYVRKGVTWEELTKLSLDDYSGDTKNYADVF